MNIENKKFILSEKAYKEIKKYRYAILDVIQKANDIRRNGNIGKELWNYVYPTYIEIVKQLKKFDKINIEKEPDKELKKCPFCGAESYELIINGAYTIICKECSCTSGTELIENKEKIIERWNKRYND